MKKEERKNKGVIFRRIHGRIVPIKTGDALAGSAMVSAGAAAAYGSGRSAYNTLIESAQYENEARKILGKRGAKKALALNLMKKSSKVHSLRNWHILVGTALGGAAIGYGLKKLGVETKKEKHSSGVTIPASYGVAAGITGASYYGRLIRVNSIDKLKKAFSLGVSRKTISYILKGI